jgi:hypothetical protein
MRRNTSLLAAAAWHQLRVKRGDAVLCGPLPPVADERLLAFMGFIKGKTKINSINR